MNRIHVPCNIQQWKNRIGIDASHMFQRVVQADDPDVTVGAVTLDQMFCHSRDSGECSRSPPVFGDQLAVHWIGQAYVKRGKFLCARGRHRLREAGINRYRSRRIRPCVGSLVCINCRILRLFLLLVFPRIFIAIAGGIIQQRIEIMLGKKIEHGSGWFRRRLARWRNRSCRFRYLVGALGKILEHESAVVDMLDSHGCRLPGSQGASRISAVDLFIEFTTTLP